MSCLCCNALLYAMAASFAVSKYPRHCLIFTNFFIESRIDCCREIYLDFIEEKKMQREFLLKHTTKRNPKDGTPFDARKYVKENVMPQIAKVHQSTQPRKTDDPPEKMEKLKEKISQKVPKPVPEVLCCLTAETTDNLLDIFKISIAEVSLEQH